MAGRLSDKVALVVGAGSIGPGWGNGKATAVLFAREGARVVCADRDEAAARETARIIENEGGRAFALAADAAKAADVAEMVAATIEHFHRIDILHNNVGIVATGGVVDLSEAEWDRVFQVNLKTCFLAMKYVIPIMERQGGGSIVNVSSVASLRHTGVDYCSYAASKSGMNHLTSVTAVQYAPKNIRVNAILPGLMKTPMVEASGLAKDYAQGDVEEMWRRRAAMVPMGRAGDAWDVAHAAVFLASDEARYVTGLQLIVDGGLT
ncbi:SDR family NAD(P)-dependent oxidoreductase, partial [Enterovirga sp.]|uniref:SDR family NAD(P)-dependent oxidoreductase n=1 Tax=Enterovirga sp. TaxID=2026350 RepID=UPI002D14C691